MLYTFPAYNKSIEAKSIDEATKELHNQLDNDRKNQELPDDSDIPRKSKKVS